MRRFASFYAIFLLIGMIGAARADESVRVGKAIQNHFSFALIEVGIANGVFKNAGLAVESVAFTGGAEAAAGARRQFDRFRAQHGARPRLHRQRPAGDDGGRGEQRAVRYDDGGRQ